MTVSIGVAHSIVLRKAALLRLGRSAKDVIGVVGDLVSEDADLLVLGPLFELDPATKKLEEMGFEYFEDFFDLTNSGGVVAEWCEIDLRLRTAEDLA